jgi:ATP-binding cassette subfamily B protein
LLAVLLFTSIGLELVNPQIIRYFIDKALAGSPIDRLIAAAVLFTSIAAVQQVVTVLSTYTSGRVGWTATNALRTDLARHCLSLYMPFHNSHTPGEMIERIDGDANELGGFFSTFIVDVLGNSVSLVGILALLFREDWRAGLALPRR